MEYIQAKNIVIKTKTPYWFGTDYTMNIYRGCSHGCIYCDSRSDCYKVSEFDKIRAKEDALKIIRNDIAHKIKKGVIATGSMSDPYNPFEKELNLTRNALEIVSASGFGISIATKSALITRDIDILSEIKVHSPVIMKITITCLEDELGKIIEPNASLSSERFGALKKLSDNKIYAGVLLMPILPFINDNEKNIIGIVRRAKECGARFIYPFMGLTLRDGQREYFYEKINLHFNGLAQKYIAKYGNIYRADSPNSAKLYRIFKEECDKYGILYNMKDIIRSYKRSYESTQLSFFD